MRLDKALQHPDIGHSTYGDVLDGKFHWTRRNHLVYGMSYEYGSELLTYDAYDGLLTINLAPIGPTGPRTFNWSRNLVNEHLPAPLRIKSVKEGRWVMGGLDNARSVPFVNNITFHNPAWETNNPNLADDRWIVGSASMVPYPDKSHIPAPIQRMVKKWAASYNPWSTFGHKPCGMCVVSDARLTAATLDGGTHERQHLLDHVLTGGLPTPFMSGILHEARNAPHYVTPGNVFPFRQACFQVAVWYAYRTLRSTYA